MRPLIYISGKYTKGDISENIQKAEDVMVMLMRDGFDVICPHKNTSHMEKYEDISYNKYISMDMNIVGRCDFIFMMNGWEESQGARMELRHALLHKVPILFEDKWEMVKPHIIL